MGRLLELRLIEVVDTALETELQQDLSNIIIKCQYTLAHQRQSSNPEQHLLGLVSTLSECINGLLIHHGMYAKSLRGRGHVPSGEIVRYLERCFAAAVATLVEAAVSYSGDHNFTHGQLDCTEYSDPG